MLSLIQHLIAWNSCCLIMPRTSPTNSTHVMYIIPLLTWIFSSKHCIFVNPIFMLCFCRFVDSPSRIHFWRWRIHNWKEEKQGSRFEQQQNTWIFGHSTLECALCCRLQTSQRYHLPFPTILLPTRKKVTDGSEGKKTGSKKYCAHAVWLQRERKTHDHNRNPKLLWVFHVVHHQNQMSSLLYCYFQMFHFFPV